MSREYGPDVLALFGSPRVGGNSDALMNALLEVARDSGLTVAEIRLSELDIGLCRGCRGCEGRGECVRKDGMREIIPNLLSARWVVLSTPVYFYNVPGHVKTFIDRCQSLWARKYTPPEGGAPAAISPPGRKGFVVASGASRGKNLFKGLGWTTRYFFDAVDVTDEGVYGVKGLEKMGDAEAHPDALRGAREAGERLFREQQEDEKMGS